MRFHLDFSYGRSVFALAAAAACAVLTGCASTINPFSRIETVVVIYGENRSFDNLYGLFSGANGIGNALKSGAYRQVDRDGSVMTALPPVWKTDDATVDPAFPFAMPNAPFRIDAAPVNLGLDKPTRDLVHRFYQNQEQINGGKNDMFAAISDAGALTMGHYDGSRLPMWHIATQYTLADNFFMGAFGGSFLNHFWLICACMPRFPDAPDEMKVRPDENGRLVRKPTSPPKAADGPPQLLDGLVTLDGFGINTLQSSYQPSGIAPADSPALANSARHPLPPQTQRTIGDALSEKNVSWKWYAGGWNLALVDRSQIYGGEVNFQAHHQPFNYFLRFAPGTPDRLKFLKDEKDLLDDIRNGTLPQVSFYKPPGKLNEHPGYADVMSGDEHIAGLVAKLQATPQWKNMVIIVTYDENGGFWDHVAPPKGDRWGPGMRIPAIIISPYARKGYIDSTPYDTTSIIKFLTRRFGLQPLPGVRPGAGDLGNAFVFND